MRTCFHLKTVLGCILGLFSCLTVLPQGQVVFDNRVFNIVVAPVYGVEPSNQGLVKQGNTAAGTPPGTQTYTGASLSGSGFSAQFFGGPTNALLEDLRPLLPRATFQTGSLSGFVFPPPNAVTVGDVPEGAKARLQLRAWDNRGGAITNWLQVLADPSIPRSESRPFITPTLGGVYQPPANPIGLESSNLATGAVPAMRIRINFQPAGTPVPPGYLPDYGLAYGARSNGLAYGWSGDCSGRARRQNSTNSPDARYDSFMAMDGVGGALWEIAVTNGAYRVHVTAGDPQSRDAVYRIEVEHVLTVNGTPVVGNNWVESDAVVVVTDGNLTVQSAEGCYSNRLCFLEISPIDRPQLFLPTPANLASNNFQLAFLGDRTVKYRVESTTDFLGWAAAGDPSNSDSNFFQFSAVTTDGEQQFYRTKTMTMSPPILVYSNGFEGSVGTEWIKTNVELTPAGGRQFLGRFGQTTNRLSLTNLPAHTRLKIAFDLFVLQSWDGNTVTNGPDGWELNVTGGPVLLSTTFHAQTTNANLRQSYPGPFPGSSFLPRIGASENNTLGYNPTGDSIYHLSYTFPHRTNFVEFNFIGRTTELMTNESWGLDDITVYCDDNPY